MDKIAEKLDPLDRRFLSFDLSDRELILFHRFVQYYVIAEMFDVKNLSGGISKNGVEPANLEERETSRKYRNNQLEEITKFVSVELGIRDKAVVEQVRDMAASYYFKIKLPEFNAKLYGRRIN